MVMRHRFPHDLNPGGHPIEVNCEPQAMAELRREVASLAVMAAERVISRSLDDQAHRQLVEQFLEEQPAQAGRA